MMLKNNIKRIISKVKQLDIFYLDKKLVKIFYIICISFVIASIIGYIYAYFKQQKIIDNKKLVISFLTEDTTTLNNLLNSNELDLKAYYEIIHDKDYMRYIAFKHSNIVIPEDISAEDLIVINRMVKKFDIPQKYIWRLIYKESRYNHKAKSHVGAKGYMQIMPNTFKYLKNKYLNVFGKNTLDKYSNEQINLVLGIYYLHILYEKYDNWSLVFAAYNAGPGKVDACGGRIPNIEETINYVKFITKN